MSRVALVVGINTYQSQQLNNLGAAARDAEAIAQCLGRFGSFRVNRLPEVVDKATSAIKVGEKTSVTLCELKEALVQLFKPTGTHIPDTALFFFGGHGVRDDLGIQEGFLATSDANIDQNFYGLSLQWLRRLLQESPVKQQLVWLDCCYSGELLNFAEINPGSLEGRDRSFIAASLEYKQAYEETAGNHGLLTSALLRALDPDHRPDRRTTNYTLADAVRQALRSSNQHPLFYNFGDPIILTTLPTDDLPEKTVEQTVCPYRGLGYFDSSDEDAKVFFGRTALTSLLLNKVETNNFVAVVGASGSGKSSLVRAGLLYQLSRGDHLFGSEQWSTFGFRPGEHPLQSLAAAFLSPGDGIHRAEVLQKAECLIGSGAVGLTQLIRAFQSKRIVLIIDQFEECFTQCHDAVERQKFFECLLGAIAQSGKKLCLVITLRADFFGKCLEQTYAGLGKQIQENLITVTPMNRQELRQAITQPAAQVKLQIEPALVEQMLQDVESSPGSLPLLQYTLTELWNQRQVNWLTIAAYHNLGGVRGALQRRADEIYGALSADQQQVAQQIFLELTQLGEGTEDTRRQVLKRELVTSSQSEALVNEVIQVLAQERLIITSELVARSDEQSRMEVIDIAHEALIRHWSQLRQWIDANRIALKQRRAIEDAAEEWLAIRESRELAYLLQGPKLTEAEVFLQTNSKVTPLSTLAQRFVRVSQEERDRYLRENEARKRRELDNLKQRLMAEEQSRKATEKALRAQKIRTIAVSLASILILTAGGFTWWQRQQLQLAFYDLWSGFNSKEIRATHVFSQLLNSVWIKINPSAFQTTEALAELLKTAQDFEQAAKRSGNEADIGRAIAYFRQVRAEVSQRLNSTGDNDTSKKATLKTLLNATEEPLAQLIETHRMPQLLKQLENAKRSGQFGTLMLGQLSTAFERRYTKGPLQTTYTILMRDLGIKADLNDDGTIGSQAEANMMPCKTLQKLQTLWRQATQNRCDWYDPQSTAYQSTFRTIEARACRELGGKTLTELVFNFAPQDFAINRLNACRIAPKRLVP